MAKPTKNILTRDYIANELRKKNARDCKGLLPPLYILSGALYLFLLFCFLFAYLSVLETLLIPLAFAAPFLTVAIIYSVKFSKERKRILCGEFEIVTRPLQYKEERAVHGYRRYDYMEVLVFRDFKAFPVEEHTAYELATNGDEYYIVYYKNSKHIRLAYSTKMYEYKDNTAPTFTEI